jgi:hypothetical protein
MSSCWLFLYALSELHILTTAQLLFSLLSFFWRRYCYEEPVIIISEVMTTKFKYNQKEKNPNKWWNREELKWLPKEQKVFKNQQNA